jgi:hypothetical protein
MPFHYQPLYSPPKNSFGHHPKKGGPDVRPVPLDVTSFSEMIAGKYLYIDKTKLIHRLISQNKIFFLCRPHRFGKTVLLDTLRHLFNGEKKLFENLWIGQGKYEFIQHPVIDLDFKITEPELMNTKNFRNFILLQVKRCGLDYGINVKIQNCSMAFAWLVDALYKKFQHGVVVLVDNYDSPLTSQFPDRFLNKRNNNVMAECLTKLSRNRSCQRFVLLVGQNSFPFNSLYTVMPRPFDLTFNKYFGAILGITTKELDRHCYEHMKAATEELQENGRFSLDKTVLDFRRALLYNYNGYCFDGETRVINPYTLMHALRYKTFDEQAFNLELPKKQVKMIKDNNLTFELFDKHNYVPRINNYITLENVPVFPYLLQTGLLTVSRKRFIKGEHQLLLRFPSHEVRKQLFLSLLADGRKTETMAILQKRIAIVYKALQSLSVPAMETAFKLLLASVQKPMYISESDYFHNDLYLATRMLFQPLDFDDPRNEGVLEGAIDIPGGHVFIVQIRSADREWVFVEHEPFKDGDVRTIAWPWRLPDVQRVLDPVEKQDPFWVKLSTFMDLQAYKALEDLIAKNYSERFFPYISDSTKVFYVGVAVYQREKVRVLYKESPRIPNPSLRVVGR